MFCVAALKSPAAFHGQIRSLERARVRHSVRKWCFSCGLIAALCSFSALKLWWFKVEKLHCDALRSRDKRDNALMNWCAVQTGVTIRSWKINCIFNYHVSVFCFQTENFLKHKIRSRPERAELVRMHILQGTSHSLLLSAYTYFIILSSYHLMNPYSHEIILF